MFGLPEGEDLNWFGQVFLLAAYGFILFKAAVLIGDGSEKLLLLYGPGIIGGLVIPILGAVPDGAIVLVSGLGPDAQDQISVGVGTLAGSTIMLLTLPWAGAVLLGRRDYDENTQRAAVKPGTNKPKCANPLSMTGSCVTTYASVPLGAKLMMATAASYLIVCIPAAVNKGSSEAARKEQLPALVGLIVCAVVFFAYSIYQVYDSNAATAQQMAQNRAKFDRWKSAVGQTFGTLEGAAEVLFEKFDTNKNGTISVDELYEGLASLGLECSRQEVFDIMKKMNTDEDDTTLSLSEFRAAIRGWAGHMFVPKEGIITAPMLQRKRTALSDKLRDRSADPMGSASAPPQKTLTDPATNDNDNENENDDEFAEESEQQQQQQPPQQTDDEPRPAPKRAPSKAVVITDGSGQITAIPNPGASLKAALDVTGAETATAAADDTAETTEETDLLGGSGSGSGGAGSATNVGSSSGGGGSGRGLTVGYQATAKKWTEKQTNSFEDAFPSLNRNRTLIEQRISEMWQQNEDEHDDDDDDNDEDGVEELELNRTDSQILWQAMTMLFSGTLLCVIFSDPMVAVISNFSDTISVPSFFISFILTPIASNAAEIYSTLVFAKKKTTEGISLGFSALYGAACMNNSFCLCIFCILIYTQELEWTFMVETLVILLTILVVGIIGLNETVFVWQACIVASMFPLSLLLVAVLDKPLDD